MLLFHLDTLYEERITVLIDVIYIGTFADETLGQLKVWLVG